jgi:hypothetical protein
MRGSELQATGSTAEAAGASPGASSRPEQFREEVSGPHVGESARAPAEMRTREQYASEVRNRGEPIPSGTSHGEGTEPSGNPSGSADEAGHSTLGRYPAESGDRTGWVTDVPASALPGGDVQHPQPTARYDAAHAAGAVPEALARDELSREETGGPRDGETAGAPAEVRTREQYASEVRSRGEPIPAGTGHDEGTVPSGNPVAPAGASPEASERPEQSRGEAGGPRDGVTARAPAEVRTREQYAREVRGRGEPIPAGTGRDEGTVPSGNPACPDGEAGHDVVGSYPAESGDRTAYVPGIPASALPGGDIGDPQSQLAVRSDAARAGTDTALAAARDGGSGQREAGAGAVWHLHSEFKGASEDWYLDAGGAVVAGPDTGPRENVIGVAEPAERAGDLIADLDDVKRSWEDGFSRKVCKEGLELPDAGKNLTGTVEGLFPRPRPPVSAYTAADSRPAVTQVQREGIDTGSAVTGIILAGVLAIKAGQSGIRRWHKQKEQARRR